MITLAGHGDLSRETVEAVAWGGQRLALAQAAVERVAAGQAELAALLAGGTRVYGVSTGMGWLASVDLDPAAQERHQRNLLLGRAVGGPPWLEAAEARALLVARLGNLLSGHAGVGPELCRFLVDRVNDGFVPAVPRRGAGSPGEVVPLAHAFQTLAGAGLVLRPDGSAQDAGAALAERGALPHRLRAKEGIALLAGSPLATALALARLRSAERLAGQLLASAAAAIDALQAPLDPYDEAIGRLAGDPLLGEVLADLRRAAGGRAARGGGAAAGAGVVPGGAADPGPAAADAGAAGRGRAAGAGGRHRLPGPGRWAGAGRGRVPRGGMDATAVALAQAPWSAGGRWPGAGSTRWGWLRGWTRPRWPWPRRPSWPASASTACSTAASAGSPTSSAPTPGR